MNQDLWRRAEALFHAALERPPEARRAFLDEACAGDRDLRRQVGFLLSTDQRAGSFLEKPAVEDETVAPGPGGLPIGRQCGPYRIVSLLGAGGMGEVYRAHDDRLGRDVAIKMLPPQFARDPARLARFRREARALAALNHPHIAAIYGLEETEEADYLVLELVEGDAPRGPMALGGALDVACQVAEALQAAHERGIVHRDLKPANLKVTSQGTVKVLDFGLAKAIWGNEPRPNVRPVVAEGASGTIAGHIVGTPGYMSPEQARGAEVDQRTDIWAFGCLLFELLAGARAFESDTPLDTIAAVLEREPDWRSLPDKTPAKLVAVLQRCLHKDPNCRWSTIADVRAALADVRRRPPRASPRRAAEATARQPRRPAPRIRALAVLPLANVARDPEQEYFADGMTEALIAELAQIRALHVISRSSVMHYKGTAKTAPEIARELGVDGIVEGSVMRAGERVRITAELVEAASDRHVWARSYERDMRDVLQLQGEVARAIADEIQVTVTPQERARLARARPVNVASHEAYTRGRYHWGRVHPDRSIEHFQRAIEIDPDNALAYAGIADAQCMMFGAAMEAVPPTQVAPLARTAALKALELDESLAEPHVSLARVLFWHDRDPVGAERELCRAIQLHPSCAMAHFHHGLLCADLRRDNEAVAAIGRALQLDPVSCWNSAISGYFLSQLGHPAGPPQLQKTIELDPTFFLTWSFLAMVQSEEGRHQEAEAAAEEAMRLAPGLPLTRAWAAYVVGRAGRRADALSFLDQLEGLAGQRYVPAIARAWCWLGLGEYERVFEWLEEGYRQRDSQLPHLAMMRAFRPLGPDPRFQDLLRRMNLRA